MSREGAIKVLKEVQSARDTLERNIVEVCRRHEQVDLFTYLDVVPRFGEEENDVFRIKRQVNEKIKEINNEIQDEVYKKTNSKQWEKGIVDRKRGRYPLSQINKKSASTAATTQISSSKMPLKQPKHKAKREKSKGPKKSEPPKSSTAYDELILQHLYGRQPHQTHRHTYKDGRPGFCSPHKFNVTKAVDTVHAHASYSTSSKAPADRADEFIHPRDQYCIHLRPHDIPPYLVNENLSTGISLAEPSRCLSDRLPLSTISNEGLEKKLPQFKPRKCQLSNGPKVAVINIKADDISDCSSARNRIKAKVRDRLKRRLKLNVQPLPNVDIDTTDPSVASTVSSSMSINDSDNVQKSAKDSVSHMSNRSVDHESTCQFNDFISVKDIPGKCADDTHQSSDDTHKGDESKADESFMPSQVSLQGCKNFHQQEYHGPSFPPQQFGKVDFIDTTPMKMSPTLEQSAQDWLEKELLARLISQMIDQQNQIPNCEEYADHVCMMSVQSDESKSSHDWIENIIGLQGIQLFVDAGIPVNRDLIKELIEVVILEYLETLFGYPQPVKDEEPLDVESTVEMKVPTPIPTPRSSPVSENKNITTPDQTIEDLSEQIIDHVNESISTQEENNGKLSYEIIKTPEVSILDDGGVPNKDIVTPDVTLIDDSELLLNYNVQTPPISDKGIELTQIPLSDFEHTEKVLSPVSTLADDRKLSGKELDITPPPVVVIAKPPSPKTTSPSISSTTITLSSSSAIGLSSVDEISVGEYLNSDSAVTDASEGELKPAGILKPWKLTDIKPESIDDTFCIKPQRYSFPSKPPRPSEKLTHRIDDISEGEISLTQRTLKSIGEVSDIPSDQSNIEAEELDIDIEESKLIRTLNNQNDPVIRLLRKIKSPADIYPGSSGKSEGEVIPHQMKYRAEKLPCLSSGENISEHSLNVVDESDLVTSLNEDSNLTPLPVTRGRVVNVKPISQNNDENEFKDMMASDGEILNNENIDYSSHVDISKSEGEFLNSDLELKEDIDIVKHDSGSDDSIVDEEDKEKVVMVLRLPEVNDDQNITDDDISVGDISTISELE